MSSVVVLFLLLCSGSAALSKSSVLSSAENTEICNGPSSPTVLFLFVCQVKSSHLSPHVIQIQNSSPFFRVKYYMYRVTVAAWGTRDLVPAFLGVLKVQLRIIRGHGRGLALLARFFKYAPRPWISVRLQARFFVSRLLRHI